MSGVSLDTYLTPTSLLYDSKVCRLCGELNDNGQPLFRTCDDSGECEVSQLINRYLPVKVSDDRIRPRWICPGCHIQLDSTAQFFDMILRGQQQIEVRIEKQETVVKSVRVEDLGQLCDTLDQEKWNQLFDKPELITSDKMGALIPLELLELDDLFKPSEMGAKPVPVTKQQVPVDPLYETAENGVKTSPETHFMVISEVTKSDIKNLVKAGEESGHQPLVPTYVCDVCGKSFTREPFYLRHRKTHAILFECGECLLKFSSNDKLMLHQQETLHDGQSMVEALQAYPENNSITEVANPYKKENSYVCDNCDNTFTDMETLLQHKTSDHTAESLPVICIQCGKGFQDKDQLLRHRETHAEDRPYRCAVCDIPFKSRSTLRKHKQSHADSRRYRCTICDQRFVYKSALDKHSNWHKGIKPYECEFCSKRFGQRSNLQEHRRVHSGDKPFQCNVCDARFATSSQHRKHVERHTNARPYTCVLCGKSYSSQQNYRSHQLRHRNEKPFACENCPRTFTERGALKKHMLTHTKEQPYSCEHCGKAFSERSNRNRHVAKLHATVTTAGLEEARTAINDSSAEDALYDVTNTAMDGTLDTLADDGMQPSDSVVYLDGN